MARGIDRRDRVGHLQPVLLLAHYRHQVLVAQGLGPHRSPGERLAVELVKRPLGDEPRGLNRGDVGGDVAVQGIHPAIAARAPEQLVDRQLGGRCDAVGGAGGGGDRIGEERDLGVEDRGQRRILPQRIELGDIGNIEAGLLEAEEVGEDLHPVEQRVDVVVRLPLR
jgi:hypothetical protein